MKISKSFLVAVRITACLLALCRSAQADQAKAPAALVGQVTSQEDGSLEGVLVSARKAGSTFSVTVVSDQHGQYSFPRKDLGPGQYSVRIRATGYDLDDPGAVQVMSRGMVTANLKLHKIRDVSSQLTTTEWLESFPGTDDQKIFLLGCGSCHTLERVAKSHYTPEEWMSVYERMGSYYAEDSTARPEKARGPSRFQASETLKKQAEYMSSINLSTNEKWAFPLKTLPRPAGRATHVVITEYDLPREVSVPHDVVVDKKGKVWFSDAGWMTIGQLDPGTGKVLEYSLPQFKSDLPIGLVDLEIDKQGNLWIGLNEQIEIAKFDTTTLKFTFWDPEKVGIERTPFLMPFNDDVDGKVWTTDVAGIDRLDIRSGEIERFDVFRGVPQNSRGHRVYQVASDSHNNCYFLDTAGGVGRVDAKSKEISYYPTPTPNSYSRRGHVDSQDRFWFAEFYANRIGLFDTWAKTFTEWEVPNPWTAPYEAGKDRNGDIWAVGSTSDRVQRLNPESGQFTEYLLPRYTDARRISFDNSHDHAVLWIPNKNNASIVKVEATD